MVIDEIDAVAADPECRALLAKIASKCRSEAVALIIAGQRATVQWMGGGDLRANVDIAVLGRFARAAEARKATGEEADLPDMGAYGEGHPGVFLVTELGGGGGYDRGRVFKLSEPDQLDKIVAGRLARQRPYTPEPGFARMAKLWAQITGTLPDDGTGSTGAGPGDAGVPDLGLDLAEDADETAAVTAKIAAARELAAQDPELTEIPPEMREHAAAMLAERRRQFFEALTDVTIPDAAGSVLLSLIAAPAGTSTREAAQVIAARTGKPVSYQTVFRWCQRLRLDGVAEVRGTGSTRRWHLTAAASDDLAGQAAVKIAEAADAATGSAYPVLRLVRGRARDDAP